MVLPTYFLAESQHLAQLSRETASKVQIIPMVNTLGDRRRKIRNFNNKKYFLHKRKEKDIRPAIDSRADDNNKYT